MSPQHKQALAQGREQGRAVRRYLEALEQNRPRRGRRRTGESIRRQLATIEQRLDTADALSRLHLNQERRDLVAELNRKDVKVDMAGLESDFIKAAKPYGERRGVSYATWREAGVEADVLKRAGIDRGSRT